MEKSANTVDVTLCTSSTSLYKPRVERIVNKHLKRDSPPPWGKDTAENWRNRFERTLQYDYAFLLTFVTLRLQ